MMSLLAHAFTPAKPPSATASDSDWFEADVQLLGHKELGRIYIRREGEKYHTKMQQKSWQS